MIGVISIVLGSGGILFGIWGALAPLFMDTLIKLFPALTAQAEQSMRESAAWAVPTSVVAACLAALLLAAGVALVKQRPQAVGRCRLWAVLKILYGIAYTVLQYPMLRQMMQEQQDAGALPAAMTELLIWITVATTLGWIVIYPVFLLIWFGRSKIALEVADWR
ncbi:MAG: hypothetical protein GY778_09340 [bacterium]|nr:hypothetical protein [bacterium]